MKETFQECETEEEKIEFLIKTYGFTREGAIQTVQAYKEIQERQEGRV